MTAHPGRAGPAAGSSSTPTTGRSPTAYPPSGLWHSGGARLAEGVLSLHAVGRIFHVMTQASGVIPQISVVLGPATGGAAYGPALTDVVILGPEGRIFVTGPDVVRSVTGEDVDMLRLSGSEPLVDGLLDKGTMQELHARWATHIVAALGRFGDRTVGVVDNNPLHLGGCLDSLSAEKASRFVRMCDAFASLSWCSWTSRATAPASARSGT